MVATPLRRFLQSLCSNSCWNYAVFWKLQQQNQMVLMWEDGYFGTLKVQDVMENTFAETSAYNGTFCGDAVELAIASISTINYALGDGVVGDVAYTGECRWVFADSKSYGNFNTASNPEHADEWLFQFAVGVKTVLLVPVIPLGVLQLGSLEDVCNELKRLGLGNTLKWVGLGNKSNPLGLTKGNLHRILPEDAQMANYIKDEFFAHQDFMEYANAFTTSQHLSSKFPSSLISTMMKSSGDSKTINDIIWPNHKLLTKSPATPTSGTNSSHLSGAIEYTDPLNQSTDLITPEIPMKQQLVRDVVPLLNFPRECELHKALGPAFMGKVDNSFQHLSVVESSSSKTNGMVFSGSFGHFSSLAKRENINEKMGLEGSSSLNSNQLAPAFFTRVKNYNNSTSHSAVTYEGAVEEFTGGGQQSNYDVFHKSKGSKASVASKKRVKSGAKQKARPRDRQLIQDRLKDLRELVPEGAKCSIDGLLDRTVKHMLFLKSVTDGADKLRQCLQSEKVGTGLKNNKTSVVKDCQNGASWAFELGGDLKVCPILVEDLQYPGHMVIEMICDDSMRFLEIAEVIYGLELTIIHGVMEKHSGNTWAHYIVEAPKGFHRLDIFWPLMKLLQQQPSPISSKI